VDVPRRVFLSHTSELHDHPVGDSFVQAAQRAVLRAGDAIIDMSYFTAGAAKPEEHCRHRVENSDIYVGIIGFKYGSPVPGRSDLSYTELEFQAARDAGIPRLIFILDAAAAALLPANPEPPHISEKQQQFRRSILDSGLMVSTISSPDRLELLLLQSLLESRSPSGRSAWARSLTRDIADFTDRRAVLAQLLSDAESALSPRSTSPGISVIAGPGGSGKSTIAVHAGHLAGRHFDRHQLSVNLRGQDDERRDPAEVLGDLLEAMGVSQIAANFQAQQRQYRREMGARSLLILDNAFDEEQVEPLLPTLGGCFVLITSRRPLAIDGARLHIVDAFEQDAAVEFLAKIAGPETFPSESVDTQALAELCDYVPLALRLVAVRARAAGWDAVEAVRRLRQAPSRLSQLSYGARGMIRTLAISYEYLPDREARLFRYLALLRGPDVSALPVTALMEVSAAEASELLENLRRDQLLQSGTVRRYEFHDLVAEFARGLVEAESADPARREQQLAALRRALGAYLSVAVNADRQVQGMNRIIHRWELPDPPNGCNPDMEIMAEGGASNWFSAERLNLIAAAEVAARAGEHQLGWRIIDSITNFLEWRGHYQEWLRLRELSLEMAERMGDQHSYAVSLRDLGRVRWVVGDWPAARSCMDRSHKIFNDLRDELWAAYVQISRAVIEDHAGNRIDPIPMMLGCLPVFRAKDRIWAATTLRHLADLYVKSADLVRAAEQAREAIDEFLACGDVVAAASCRVTLGDILVQRHEPDDALGEYTLALRTLEDHHETAWAAASHRGIGRALFDIDTARAEEELAISARMFRELGDYRSVGTVRLAQAELAEKQGDLNHSRQLAEEALRVFTELGAAELQAESLVRIGRLAKKIGNAEAAIESYRRARDLYERIDTTKAAQIADLLSDMEA
jgi:hypothetical protein